MTIAKNAEPDLETVLSVLEGVKSGYTDEYSARCPAHEDNVRSLTVRGGSKRPVVAKCHAGCQQDVLWAKITELISHHALPPIPERQPASRRVVEEYVWENEDGSIAKVKVRYEPKSFAQKSADGTWGLNGTKPMLFHLPKLIEAVAGSRQIYLVEGEKDVLACEAFGLSATTAGSVEDWKPELAKYFEGAYVTIIPDWDAPGLKMALRAYADILPLAKSVDIKRCVGKDAAEHFPQHNVGELIHVDPKELGYESTSDEGVACLDGIDMTDVTWLWPGYIPFGKMTIQDGNPNEGKSMLLLALAALVSSGKPMPDGSPGVTGGVLILASEDDVSDTIKPRLMAAGANESRIFFLDDLGIPSDIAKMEALIVKYKIRLIIFDPLMAYWDEDVKPNSDPSVRQALKPLAEMAQRTDVAIIFNRHLNKNSTSGASAQMRGGGSVAIGAACRSGWLIGCFPDDPDQKYLAPTKWNLTEKPTTLKFHITKKPTIEWDGGSEVTADQLVGAAYTVNESASKVKDAKTWLISYMHDIIEVEATQVIEDAEQDGFDAQTIRRAKQKLPILHRKREGDGRFIWYHAERK